MFRTPESMIDETPITFESDFLTRLLEKWLRACKNYLPTRNDFLPEDIGPNLSKLMIISHRYDGDFEYRLVGSELEYFTPPHRISQPFTDLYQGETLRRLQTLFFKPLLSRSPASIRGSLALGHGQMIIREAILLPLCRQGETVFTQVLAGFILQPEPAAARARKQLNWL